VLPVLREHGERTRDLALDLLEAQAGPAVALKLEPLEAAVWEGFRLAEESGADWLLTCDADLLLRPGAVETLLSAAAEAPQEVFHIFGWIQDKLHPQIREGGPRLWRVDHIPKMRKVGVGGFRPESFIVHGMVRRKYRSIKLADVLADHDYHQWHKDLHRKGAFHAKKHKSWRWDALPYWQSSKDPDHKSALAGWEGRPLTIAEKGPLEYRIEGGRAVFPGG